MHMRERERGRRCGGGEVFLSTVHAKEKRERSSMEAEEERKRMGGVKREEEDGEVIFLHCVNERKEGERYSHTLSLIGGCDYINAH